MCNTGDNGNDIQPVPAHPSQFPHTNMCFADQTRKGIALQSSFTGMYTYCNYSVISIQYIIHYKRVVNKLWSVFTFWPSAGKYRM